MEKPKVIIILTDPGEKNNLSEELPELRDRLTAAALERREGIEKSWVKEFAAKYSLTR